MKNTLQNDSNYSYGNVAKDIYLRFCDSFGWNEELANCIESKFNPFVKKATPEGYSVWFLEHSNWTNTNNEIWRKTFIEEQEIVEYWRVKIFSYYDNSTRVVFAKKDGEYVFLGVYALFSSKEIVKNNLYNNISGIPVNKDEKEFEKKYIKISDSYPMPYDDKPDPFDPDIVEGHLWQINEYALIFEKFLHEYVFKKRDVMFASFASLSYKVCGLIYLSIGNVSPVIRRMKWIVDEWKIPNAASFDGEINTSEKLRIVTDEAIKKYHLHIFKNQ